MDLFTLRFPMLASGFSPSGSTRLIQFWMDSPYSNLKGMGDCCVGPCLWDSPGVGNWEKWQLVFSWDHTVLKSLCCVSKKNKMLAGMGGILDSQSVCSIPGVRDLWDKPSLVPIGGSGRPGDVITPDSCTVFPAVALPHQQPTPHFYCSCLKYKPDPVPLHGLPSEQDRGPCVLCHLIGSVLGYMPDGRGSGRGQVGACRGGVERVLGFRGPLRLQADSRPSRWLWQVAASEAMSIA